MSHQQSRSYKKPKQDPVEIRVVLGILRGLYWLVMLPFHGQKKVSKPKARKVNAIDTADITKRWSDIQMTVGLGGATHFGAAVMSADKLVDHVLRQKGYPGETMGERIKSAREDMSPRNYDGLWQAHKLRNTLAHEVTSEVMSYQAKEALEQFAAALRDLGALR